MVHGKPEGSAEEWKQKKESPAETKEERPKIGLALGSGGARGLAHIGVLEVLEEHDIPIHFIAGSSMGSLVGALYACGHSPGQLQRMISLFSKKLWVDYTMPKMGFIAGDKVKELVRFFTRNKNLEDMQIPLAIVATNLQKGERRIFRSGPVAEAVRASISIPGIFVPEYIDGEPYVDGGVIDRVPVSVVKRMGADLVLAVDVSYSESTQPITSIFDVIASSIDVMEREILKFRMIEADLLLRPKVGHHSTTSFTNVDEIMQEGKRSMLEMMPHLQVMVKKWRENEHV